MSELSILVGGKAGDGIREAGALLADVLSELGYRIYYYYDYPSLIRGGHNFSIVRASEEKIGSVRSKVDFILAVNQDTVDLHRDMTKDSTVLIYDPDSVKAEGVGIPVGKILKEEKAPPIMRCSCLIGAFCKAAGIELEVLKKVFGKNLPKETELNIKVASRAYGEAEEKAKVKAISRPPLPILGGNEAIGLGLIRAGLKTYVAYPMTPASSILHFCAKMADDFALKVIHPENEIAVMLMALGFAYAGDRVAVGTSGGGFCLMTEGLSFSGMAELPVVVVVSQRPGPSTGVPTYTAQADLNFVLNAGHGEFPRLVVAPADPEEAYFWSAVALNLAWKWQIPALVVVDKALSEGEYSFDLESIDSIPEEREVLWNGKGEYKRYLNTEDGVSPLAFPGGSGAIVKAGSYEHDEAGITTEVAEDVVTMQDKRLRKAAGLENDLDSYTTVKVYGDKKAFTAVVCWGSNKWICIEAARSLNLRVVQPVVMSPFPNRQLREALQGAGRVVCVENNATGQMAGILECHGFKVAEKILKYDGRPFLLDELTEKLGRLVK